MINRVCRVRNDIIVITRPCLINDFIRDFTCNRGNPMVEKIRRIWRA